MDVFEKRIWRGFPPRYIYDGGERADAAYRAAMEAILSVSPGNEHGLDVAKGLIEGSRGFARDRARARRVLMGAEGSVLRGVRIGERCERKRVGVRGGRRGDEQVVLRPGE